MGPERDALTLKTFPSRFQRKVNALEKKILSLVRSGGPISFERFMEMALYDPELGYYCSNSPRIGRQGDFYTSSHVHSAYGRTIGRQIEEMWNFMERPKDFRIVELAPGEGYVCRDMLDSIQGSGFAEALEYWMVERTPGQRERQRRLLSGFSGKVRWFSSLQELDRIRGCIFSNELLDAFPVHLVVRERELRELYVAEEDSRLVLISGPLTSGRISEYLEEFPVPEDEGYLTEVNLRIGDWLSAVSSALTEGFLLTVDYGYTARDYYSEDRNRGTLLCYRGHQVGENPLESPGEQDITAHVNFSSLRRWGERLGLKTVGFCSQGSFLVSLGIAEEASMVPEKGPDFLFDISRVKKLILPGGMGESHMVMAQYRGEAEPRLKGFSSGSRLRYL